MPSRDELLSKLKELGNQTLVAEFYGKHRTYVQRWMAANGITAIDYRVGHSSNKKLEESDIPMIKELSYSLTGVEIADKFDVSPQTIYNVLSGKYWAWAGTPPKV